MSPDSTKENAEESSSIAFLVVSEMTLSVIKLLLGVAASQIMWYALVSVRNFKENLGLLIIVLCAT